MTDVIKALAKAFDPGKRLSKTLEDIQAADPKTAITVTDNGKRYKLINGKWRRA